MCGWRVGDWGVGGGARGPATHLSLRLRRQARAVAPRHATVPPSIRPKPCRSGTYQRRPSSPPPRTWAMAKVMPRSMRERREGRKSGSLGIS